MPTQVDISAVGYRAMTGADLIAVSRLHADAFGPGRFARTAYRVREGQDKVSAFCRVAVENDEILAAVSFTPIEIGGRPGALLLGPLAVTSQFSNQGLGRALIADGLAAAKTQGLRLVILVGDLQYYSRIDFKPVPTGQISFPGPVDPARILGHELTADALTDYRGVITAAA